MALRNILKKGDELLTKPSREVEKIDERIIELLDDLKETLDDANGLGLAAPQVGVLKRIAVVRDGDDIIEIINPTITKSSGQQIGNEGCLSVPGRYGDVPRPKKVIVRAQKRDGKWYEYTAEELTARIFCHEIDHLDGVLFSTKVIRWND